MSLVFPPQPIIPGHVNEAGVKYDSGRKDVVFAQELDHAEGALASGRYSSNSRSVGVGGVESITEDRDLYGRGLLAAGPVGVIPIEGPGSRVMWHPGKKAFRVGEVTGASTAWDDTEIGIGSVAIGRDVKAFHDRAVVLGSGIDDLNPLASTAVDELLAGFGSDVPTVRVTKAAGAGTVGNVGLGLGATLPTALADVGASTVDRASIRLRPGVDPTAPNDGDVWYNGATLVLSVGGTPEVVGLPVATQGALLQGSSGGGWNVLPVGATGYVPRVVGGDFQWSPDRSTINRVAVDLSAGVFAIPATTVTDSILGVTVIAANAITMPNPATVGAGWRVFIKDETGTANGGANRINVDPFAAETFDGAANSDITSGYGMWMLYTDGTNWFVG